MDKKLLVKPRIIVYGTDENILLIKPHVIINESQKNFEISYIIPPNVDYRDFKFLPKGNELVVYFNEEEIFHKHINLWVEPSSISLVFKKTGSFLIIRGNLTMYEPEIQITD